MNFLFISAIFIIFKTLKVSSYIGIPLFTCNPMCLTCSGPNSDQCVTCVSGLLPIGSACSCPAGKYYAGGLNTCKPCDTSCQTCNDGTSHDCLTCPTGYQLYQGSCYHSCTSTQYLTTTDFSCASCNSLCQTCTGPSAADCTSCSTANLINGVCTCPSGYYVTTYGGCAPCDSSCKECSGSAATQCTICNNGMILQNRQCFCSTGFYWSTTQSSCLTCNETCQGCSGPSANQCTSCQNNLVLTSQQRCECPSSMYYYAQNVSCLPCSPLCSSCTGTGTNKNECTSCKNNLALTADNTCGCGSSWYLNTSTVTCVSCHKSCQECTGPSASECSSCSAAGYNLSNGRCVCAGGVGGCQCSSDEYYDADASMCRGCDASCAECSGHSSQNCTACATDFNLYLGECVCQQSTCQCLSGTYFDTPSGTCKACSSDCQECLGPTLNECTSCRNNLAIPSGSSTGVCTCGDGMFLDSAAGMCLACSSTCKTCSGPASTQCLQCSGGATLSSGSCTCNNGLYFDPNSGKCLSCNAGCQTCSGPERSQCLSCSAGSTLNNGYCVNTCTQFQYRMSDMSCQPCDASCQTCSGGTASQCKSCASPLTLSGSTCSEVSSNGCYFKCKSCLSSTQDECIQCNSGLTLIRTTTSNYGSCSANCPLGYYYVYKNGQPTCQPKIRLNNGLAYATNTDDNDGNNKIQITFDKKITPFLSELLSSISIAIDFRPDQPQLEFRYSLDLMSNSQYLMLTLTYLGHLLPGNILTINYNLPSKTSNDHNSTIYVVRQTQSIRLMEYYQESKAVTQYTQAMTQIASFGAIGNQLFSWTSSVIFRGIHALRSEIVEDMIGYIIFINIDFTPSFLKFANDGLNSFELIFPNLFTYLLEYMAKNKAYKNDDQSRLLEHSMNQIRNESSSFVNNYKIKSRLLINQAIQTSINQEISTRYFLLNNGASTAFMIIVLIVVLIIEVCNYTLSKTRRFAKLANIIRRLSMAVRWNMLIGHFSSEFQGFLFFSTLDLASNLPLTGSTDYLNLVFAIASLCISILVVISMCVLPFILHKKLRTSRAEGKSIQDTKTQDFLKRFEMLHHSFSSEKVTTLFYPTILHLRSFGFGLLLVFSSASPNGQISFLLVSSAATLLYIWYTKPFKSKSQYVLTLLYEALFFSIVIGVLALSIYSQDNILNIKARICICTIILTFATLMFVLNCVSFLIEMVEFIKRSRNKAKIIPINTLLNPAVKTTEGVLNCTNLRVISTNLTSDGDDHKINPERFVGSKIVRRLINAKKKEPVKAVPLEESDSKEDSLNSVKGGYKKGLLDRPSTISLKSLFFRHNFSNEDPIEPKRKGVYDDLISGKMRTLEYKSRTLLRNSPANSITNIISDEKSTKEDTKQLIRLASEELKIEKFAEISEKELGEQKTEMSILTLCETDKSLTPQSNLIDLNPSQLNLERRIRFRRKFTSLKKSSYSLSQVDELMPDRRSRVNLASIFIEKDEEREEQDATSEKGGEALSRNML